MILSKLFSFFPIAYQHEGEQPINNVLPFVEKTKDIPVVFISSLIDTSVAYECTKNLVDTLRDAGHNNVYLLTLENSSHPYYQRDDYNDRTKYLNFMHAIYKKYDLPYSEDQTLAGRDFLEEVIQQKDLSN